MKKEELLKKHDEAFTRYYKEAIKPCGNWHKNMIFRELEEAKKELEAISIELEKFLNQEA